VPSWKQKAMLQRVLSALPAGHRVNDLFQHYVTRGLPMPDGDLREAAALGAHHVQRLADVSGRDVSAGRFFEFGAGWDLHMPLILWCLGVERQHVVDIRPLVRADLVADVARRLAGPLRLPEFVRVPPAPDAGRLELGPYLDGLGVEYRAPCDARATGLPAGSVDFATSTNTLEHIPPGDIRAILRECHRILADDGLMSCQIDYKDHYSYFDRSISAYNFLAFDDRAWRRYNSSLHFQNRLRHRQHVALLEDAGFEIVEDS
jgi:SAM-dependent methyltransferase